jgi:hypothetical protein
MISAPPPSPPPSPVIKLSLFLSLPVCRRWSLLTGEGEEGGGGAKSIFIRQLESLVLYKSFNTLRRGENTRGGLPPSN